MQNFLPLSTTSVRLFLKVFSLKELLSSFSLSKRSQHAEQLSVWCLFSPRLAVHIFIAFTERWIWATASSTILRRENWENRVAVLLAKSDGFLGLLFSIASGKLEKGRWRRLIKGERWDEVIEAVRFVKKMSETNSSNFPQILSTVRRRCRQQVRHMDP